MPRKLFLLFLAIMVANRRTKFFKSIHYFHKQGKNCYFQPFNFGTEPYLISFGDNVKVASNVHFINHDIIPFVFNDINQSELPTRVGKINIGDNVFIGSESTILYDVNIGNNVVIGSGSIVTKDIPDNSVAVGIPCRVVGSFDDCKDKYLKIISNYTWSQNDKNKKQKQIDFFY